MSSVRVFARFRPLPGAERGCVDAAGGEAVVRRRGAESRFSLDTVFGAEASQADVFQTVAAPLVRDVVAGYNCTIFAYGQTGSGKTHTMLGAAGQEETEGLLPRCVRAVFAGLEEGSTVRAAFVEIYLERLRDLLQLDNTNLRVRELKGRGVWIDGVTQQEAATSEEVLRLVARGSANRSSGATAMNAQSSRSHSVFILTVSRQTADALTTGKLHLVDLAGSEMVRKTAASGQRLTEAKHINRSLSALGNVISALVEKHPHVPYRDSKLTRVLQDSLGGNSKTALIVTCSSSAAHVEETLSTLRFGTRATCVRNKPHVNAELTPQELRRALVVAEKQIATLTGHVERLEGQLQGANSAMTALEQDEPLALPAPSPHPAAPAASAAPAEEDDHRCRVCGEGEREGDAVFLCDGNCSGYFHAACASLDEAPEDCEWYCDQCRGGASTLAEVRGELAAAVREKALVEARWRMEREMVRALDSKKQEQRRQTQEALARLKLELSLSEEQNRLLRSRTERDAKTEEQLRGDISLLKKSLRAVRSSTAAAAPPPSSADDPAAEEPTPENDGRNENDDEELQRTVAGLHKRLEDRERALAEREAELRKARAEVAELRQGAMLRPIVDCASLAAERSQLNSRGGPDRGMRANLHSWWAGDEEEADGADGADGGAEEAPLSPAVLPANSPIRRPVSVHGGRREPAFKTRLIGLLESLQQETGSYKELRERIASENKSHRSSAALATSASSASFKDLRKLREARRASMQLSSSSEV